MPTRVIKTDVTDWDDDFEAKEPDVMSDEEIIERRKNGMHSAEVGRHTLIARERGLAPSDIVRPNKGLLQLALVMEVNQKMSKKKRVELPNGNGVDIREYVAPVNGDEDEGDIETAIADSDSKKGVEDAIAYLLKRVPGYVYGRLAIIAKSGEPGDVEKYAEKLKDIIDEIVVKLG